MAALWTPKELAARVALLQWAERRLPGDDDFDPAAIPVAVVLKGHVVAVAVYFARRGAAIEMAIAADTPRWATAGTIAELLSYPFEVFNCRRVTAVVRSDNIRSQRFVEGIGFQFEGCLRCAYTDADAAVYGMTKRAWMISRWWRLYLARRPAQEAA